MKDKVRYPSVLFVMKCRGKDVEGQCPLITEISGPAGNAITDWPL
jgi:hypothetical protein